jgi:cell division septal protein FtsQ
MNTRSIVPVTKSIVLVGMALGLIALIIYGISNLRIKQIEVFGTNATLAIDETIIPGNLMFFPTSWYEQTLSKQYPNLKTVKITKKYPSTLQITLEERSPVAFLESGSGSFPIDEFGYPTSAPRAHVSLPTIHLPMTHMIGFPIKDDTVLLGIAAITHLQNFFPVSVTRNDGASIRVKLKDLDILISHDTDLPAIERTLQTILTGVRMKGTVPTLIDVRYAKPVLMF